MVGKRHVQVLGARGGGWAVQRDTRLPVRVDLECRERHLDRRRRPQPQVGREGNGAGAVAARRLEAYALQRGRCDQRVRELHSAGQHCGGTLSGKSLL